MGIRLTVENAPLLLYLNLHLVMNEEGMGGSSDFVRKGLVGLREEEEEEEEAAGREETAVREADDNVNDIWGRRERRGFEKKN